MATPKANRVRPEAVTPSPAPSGAAEVSASQATAADGAEPEPEATLSAQQQPTTPRRTSVDTELGEAVDESLETPKMSTTKKRPRGDEDNEASLLLEPREEAVEQPSTPVDEVYVRKKRIRV